MIADGNAEFGVQHVSFCELGVYETGKMRERCVLMLPFGALAEQKEPVLGKSTNFREIRRNDD